MAETKIDRAVAAIEREIRKWNGIESQEDLQSSAGDMAKRVAIVARRSVRGSAGTGAAAPTEDFSAKLGALLSSAWPKRSDVPVDVAKKASALMIQLRNWGSWT